MTTTDIADLALDQAVCRLGALLTGLNKLYQDYRNMYGELNLGLTEALSTFRCVNAARTHHRTANLAGVVAMMVSVGVKRQYATSLVTVEIDTLCWWLIESSPQVLEVREPVTPSTGLVFRRRKKTRKDGSSRMVESRKDGRSDDLYKTYDTKFTFMVFFK